MSCWFFFLVSTFFSLFIVACLEQSVCVCVCWKFYFCFAIIGFSHFHSNCHCQTIVCYTHILYIYRYIFPIFYGKSMTILSFRLNCVQIQHIDVTLYPTHTHIHTLVKRGERKISGTMFMRERCRKSVTMKVNKKTEVSFVEKWRLQWKFQHKLNVTTLLAWIFNRISVHFSLMHIFFFFCIYIAN